MPPTSAAAAARRSQNVSEKEKPSKTSSSGGGGGVGAGGVTPPAKGRRKSASASLDRGLRIGEGDENIATLLNFDDERKEGREGGDCLNVGPQETYKTLAEGTSSANSSSLLRSLVTSRGHGNRRFIGALRAARRTTDAVREELEKDALLLYNLEAEYLPFAAGLSGLRSRAAIIDSWLSNKDQSAERREGGGEDSVSRSFDVITENVESEDRNHLNGGSLHALGALRAGGESGISLRSAATAADGGDGDGDDNPLSGLPPSPFTYTPNGAIALNTTAGVAFARRNANVLDVDRMLRARDYVKNPLQPHEIGYLVSSGGGGGNSLNASQSAYPSCQSANASQQACASGGMGGSAVVRLYHGWSVVGHETMIEPADHATYLANLTAEPCRIATLTYGPSVGLMDDLWTRTALQSRLAVAADRKLAAQLEALKAGRISSSFDVKSDGRGDEGVTTVTNGTSGEGKTEVFSHPMALIRKDV